MKTVIQEINIYSLPAIHTNAQPGVLEVKTSDLKSKRSNTFWKLIYFNRGKSSFPFLCIN
jgi:hypothetical protein